MTLFDLDGGALGPYGARVHLGYLLGLYGGTVYSDLKTIGGIRNKFAHKAENLSFGTQSIGDKCKNLSFVDTAVQEYADASNSGVWLEKMSERTGRQLIL
jgi:DNA-binding MltR family transcriptional regulator